MRKLSPPIPGPIQELFTGLRLFPGWLKNIQDQQSIRRFHRWQIS